MKKIKITWDDSGFTFNVDDKEFATDYCGFMNEDDIQVVQKLLEYLGYEVELVNPVCEDEDCDGKCGYP